MSDNTKKEGLQFENGNVTVSQQVIATIVKDAMADIEGVHCLASDMVENKNRKFFINVAPKSESIKVSVNKSELSLEVCVVLNYGTNVIDVAGKIQEKVKDVVENVVGLPVKDIDVTVDGIYVEEN